VRRRNQSNQSGRDPTRQPKARFSPNAHAHNLVLNPIRNAFLGKQVSEMESKRHTPFLVVCRESETAQSINILGNGLHGPTTSSGRLGLSLFLKPNSTQKCPQP
jgi:hypothetical protein